MRRFINSRLGKVLSQAFALTLFVPYVTLITATSAVAQQIARPTWAVLDFVNSSGHGPANMGTVAADAVRSELEKLGKYDAVPRESIDRAYVSLNLQPPVTQKVSLLRLGAEIQASSIVTGEIINWRIVKDGAGKRADVIVQVQVLDVASGVVVNGAALSASSSIRPPDTADDTMLADALQTAANVAITNINAKELPRATVLNTSGETALLNQGARSGFKVGQNLIVLRGREQVATAVVSDIEPDAATVKVVTSKQGIRPGDKVRAIFTPEKVKGSWNSHNDVVTVKPKPRSPNSGLLTVLAVVGLVAFVILSNPNGQDLVSVFRAEATNQGTASLAAVKLSWSPDMFTKGFDRRVQWQIWRNTVPGTPVLITPGSQITVIDDSFARAFTYGDIPDTPAGGFTCDNPTMPTATIDPAAPVPGVVSGVPLQYRVSLIYRIPGGELPTPVQEDWCYFTSSKTNAIGTATPYDPVGLITPSDGETISGPVTFTFNSVGSVLAPGVVMEYIVEISSSITFAKAQTITMSKFQTNQLSGTLTAGPFDLSGVFASSSTMYWRVGVRNIDDKPGPAKDLRTGERYVFCPPRAMSRL